MRKAAGIEDLHIHDLRHEAISRVAETGAFTLLDLAAFSGHRELSMLQRYTHLCSKRMAHKLDEVFKKATNTRQHKGRKFLSKAGLELARPALEEIGMEGVDGAADGSADHAAPPPAEPSKAAGTASATQPSDQVSTAANVIRFPTRRRA